MSPDEEVQFLCETVDIVERLGYCELYLMNDKGEIYKATKAGPVPTGEVGNLPPWRVQSLGE